MEQSTPTSPGKSMGVASLVIGIVALLGGIVVFFVSVGYAAFEGGLGKGMGLAVAWLVFCLCGMLLGISGMKKNKAVGQKAGVAKGGMILGILTVLFSLGIMSAVYVAHSQELEATIKQNAEIKALLGDTAAQKSSDDAVQHMIDSMNAANNATSDTVH